MQFSFWSSPKHFGICRRIKQVKISKYRLWFDGILDCNSILLLERSRNCQYPDEKDYFKSLLRIHNICVTYRVSHLALADRNMQLRFEVRWFGKPE